MFGFGRINGIDGELDRQHLSNYGLTWPDRGFDAKAVPRDPHEGWQ